MMTGLQRGRHPMGKLGFWFGWTVDAGPESVGSTVHENFFLFPLCSRNSVRTSSNRRLLVVTSVSVPRFDVREETSLFIVLIQQSPVGGKCKKMESLTEAIRRPYGAPCL